MSRPSNFLGGSVKRLIPEGERRYGGPLLGAKSSNNSLALLLDDIDFKDQEQSQLVCVVSSISISDSEGTSIDLPEISMHRVTQNQYATSTSTRILTRI